MYDNADQRAPFWIPEENQDQDQNEEQKQPIIEQRSTGRKKKRSQVKSKEREVYKMMLDIKIAQK